MSRVIIWPVIFLGIIVCSTLNAQENEWTTRMELSYVSTSGNTSTQTLSGKLDMEGLKGKTRFFLKSACLASKNEEKEVANKWTSEIRVERIFSGRFFGFIGLNYLRDRFAGFKYRLNIGPGLGIDIVKYEKHMLKCLVSSTYYWETYSVESVESDQFISAKFGLNYEWIIRQNVSYKASCNYAMSLENSSKYYLFGETSLSVSISDNLAIGISYLVNFQNLVPDPEIGKTDTSFLTSFIITL